MVDNPNIEFVIDDNEDPFNDNNVTFVVNAIMRILTIHKMNGKI